MKSKWHVVQEGKAKVRVPSAEVMTKDLPVFYNPVMSLNRSVSVSLLRALARGWRVADILAGSGVRSIRFSKELPKSKVHHMLVNDANPAAVRNIRQNVKLNSAGGRMKVTKNDASLALLQSEPFDYIDIDPFGSPNPFLDAAVKRLKYRGILAVTATDTAALCGTSPGACRRKYWARPRRDENMREWGLRILARKVQLIGAQYEKALHPVLSHATQHYMRIYFRMHGNVNAILDRIGGLDEIGPLWLGSLWDKDLLASMKSDDPEAQSLIDTLAEEAEVDAVGIYDSHAWAKRLKVSAPKMDDLMGAVEKAGYDVAISHISPTAVRSTIPCAKFEKLFRKL